VKAHAGIYGNEIADRLGIKRESSPPYCGQLRALKKLSLYYVEQVLMVK